MFRRSEARHAGVALALAAALAACGAPDVGRLSEVEVADEAGTAQALPAPEPEGGGFFSRLFGGGRDGAGAPRPEATPEAEAPQPRAEAAAPAPDASGGGGFLSRLFGGAGGGARPRTDGAAEVQDIAFGTRLPYGTLGRLCDVPNRRLGREIARFPERRPMYRLYDSEPGNTAAHAFYITGFADGCVRQFTAALAMFGAPSTHEFLRYGQPAELHPFSATDEAYETLKRQVCGVGRGRPCGNRIDRMERDTVFVSIYERFGVNATWKNLLLHDGEVLAIDLKSG
jgi:hypothetical protein